MLQSKAGHIFRISMLSAHSCCAEKNPNCSGKLLADLLQRLELKDKVNREASALCPQITSHSLYDYWREPHTEFCKLYFEGRSHR